MAENQSAVRACPLCGARTGRRLAAYAPREWDVSACGACGFVYLANPPAEEALEAGEAAWEESSAVEQEKRVEQAPTLYRFDKATRLRTRLFRGDEMTKYRRWFGAGGNVLDVGCAEGSRLRAPFTPFGIEVSRALAAKADARMRALGGYCVQGTGAEAIQSFPENHFDGILFRSYLEHETEPRRALAGAARVVKRSGAVYVKVPNYGSLNRRVVGRHWCGFRHPDHVNYFTPETLRQMAAAEGFGMQILNPINLVIDDNIHALLRLS
ncbi:MAG: class I SAM-dependent methyltransferase [Pseudomonadota bacterium]